MDNFGQNQKEQIRETSMKLGEIAGHPAYPFLLKTFRKIVVLSQTIDDSQEDGGADLNVEIYRNQVCYSVNLLTAFNNRIDCIIRENW